MDIDLSDGDKFNDFGLTRLLDVLIQFINSQTSSMSWYICNRGGGKDWYVNYATVTKNSPSVEK